MKLYIFAVSSERGPASVVYESEAEATSNDAIETLIKSGYSTEHIRCVAEASLSSFSIVIKEK